MDDSLVKQSGMELYKRIMREQLNGMAIMNDLPITGSQFNSYSTNNMYNLYMIHFFDNLERHMIIL